MAWLQQVKMALLSWCCCHPFSKPLLCFFIPSGLVECDFMFGAIKTSELMFYVQVSKALVDLQIENNRLKEDTEQTKFEQTNKVILSIRQWYPKETVYDVKVYMTVKSMYVKRFNL